MIEEKKSGILDGSEGFRKKGKEYSRQRGGSNPKTDVVVPVSSIVPVTIRRTTIDRIVVPRTTTEQ